MNTRISKSRTTLALVFGAGLVTTCFGFDANNWQPVNGKWDGKWSDTRHWSRGHVPNGDDAIFNNTSGHEIVVEVDKDFVSEGTDQAIPTFIKFGHAESDPTVYSPVRLVGSGKLTQSANASIYNYPNTHAILDGNVTIDYTRGWTFYPNCTLEVRGNAYINLNSSAFSLWGDGSRLLVNGGKIDAQYIGLGGKNETYRMTGGQVTLVSYLSTGPTGTVEVAGGTLTLGGNLIPGVASSLAISGGTINANKVENNNDGTMKMTGGELMLNDGILIDDAGSFELTDGTCSMPSGTLELRIGSSAVIRGGSLEFKYFGGSVGFQRAFTMTGGEVTMNSGINKTYFADSRDFKLLGGTFRHTAANAFIGVLPAGEDAVYWHDLLMGNSEDFADNFCRPFRGHYVQTNHTAWLRFNMSDGVAYGGGVLDISILYLNKNSKITLDLSRIDIDYCPYISSGAVLYLPRDIHFGCFGPYTRGNCYGSFKVPGKITFETTDCFDATKSYTVQNCNLLLTPGMEMAVTGAGTLDFVWSTTIPYNYATLASFTLGDGTTFSRTAAGKGGGVQLCGQRHGRVTLGAGATYKDYANSHAIEATELTFGAGAKYVADLTDITFSETIIMGGGWSSRPFLNAAKSTGVSAANIETKNAPSGMDIAIVQAGPNFALRNRNFSPLAPVFDFTWTNTTGATACKLDARENYFRSGTTAQAKPGTSSAVFFMPIDVDKSREVVVPAEGMTVGRVSFGGCDSKDWRRASDPYHFTGGKLTLSVAATGYGCTYFNCTPNPVVFDCDVEGSGTYAGIYPYTFVAFNKNFNAKEMSFVGTVVFGGTATISGAIVPQREYSGSREASITVMDGATLTIGKQDSAFSNNMSLLVEEGGVATVSAATGAFWSSGASRFDHIVNGTLNLGATFQAMGNTTALFTGTGTVNLGSFTPAFVSTGTVELARSIRVNAGALNTASTSGSMRIKVQSFQKPTLGATADWTYGVASGVSTTSEAANRALTLDVGAELAIDTADPANAETGHSVTIADPISAAKVAKIVKRGKGTLTLTNADNSFAEEAGIRVEGGAVAWTVPQTLGSLSGTAEGQLLYAKVGDAIPMLTVTNNVDLTGVMIDPADAETRDFARTARSIITVPAGCKITGQPASKVGTAFHVVTDPDTGAQTLTARIKRGTLVLVF